MLDKLLDRAPFASVPAIFSPCHDLKVDNIQLHSPPAAPESEEATIDPLEMYTGIRCAQELRESDLNWVFVVNNVVLGF